VSENLMRCKEFFKNEKKREKIKVKSLTFEKKLMNPLGEIYDRILIDFYGNSF
jgi:hypothetical protein